MVSEGLTTPGPSHLSFVAASPSQPGLQLVGTIALLLQVVHLVTGEPDLTIHKLASPDYDTAVTYIIAIDDNTISKELPHVPAERYAALRRAADQQLKLYTRSNALPASPGGASLLAPDLPGAVRPDKRWAFNHLRSPRRIR